jgi:hypothetical protein
MTVEETTERINRHQLVRLLDTMSSLERQAITHRMLISDLDAAMPAPEVAGPRHPRPPSHVAAMLPPVKPLKRARPTLVGAPRPIEVVAPPVAVPVPEAAPLSSQVIAQLSVEEVAMLPQQFRPIAAALELEAPPRVTPVAQPARPWLAMILSAALLVALVVLFTAR